MRVIAAAIQIDAERLERGDVVGIERQHAIECVVCFAGLVLIEHHARVAEQRAGIVGIEAQRGEIREPGFAQVMAREVRGREQIVERGARLFRDRRDRQPRRLVGEAGVGMCKRRRASIRDRLAELSRPRDERVWRLRRSRFDRRWPLLDPVIGNADERHVRGRAGAHVARRAVIAGRIAMRFRVGARGALVALQALDVPPPRVFLERARVRIVTRGARHLLSRTEPARAAHQTLGVIEQLHAILLGRIREGVDARRIERLAGMNVEVIAALAQHRERRLMTLRAHLELAARRQVSLRADGVFLQQRRDVLLARPVATLAADAVRQRIAKPLCGLVAVARDAIRVELDPDPRVAAERHRIEIPARRLRVVVDRQMDQPAAAFRVKSEPVAAGAKHVRDRLVPRCDRATGLREECLGDEVVLAAPHRRVAEVAAIVDHRRRGVEDGADPRLIDRRDRPHPRACHRVPLIARVDLVVTWLARCRAGVPGKVTRVLRDRLGPVERRGIPVHRIERIDVCGWRRIAMRLALVSTRDQTDREHDGEPTRHNSA